MKKFCVGLTALFTMVLLIGCTMEPPKESAADRQVRITKEKADAAELQKLERDRQIAQHIAAQKVAKEKKEKEFQEWLAAYEKERAAKKTRVEAERKERAKPVVEKMKQLPTKTEGNALIVQPGTPESGDEKTQIEKALKAERHYTTVKPPYPAVSESFKPEVFQKVPNLPDMHHVVPTKDGGIAVAARDGGYLIDKDGKVQIVGKGKDCTAVAVSPLGEVAFAFAFTKERKLTLYFPGRDPWTTDDSRTVIEIHVVGPKPRVVLLGQWWRQCNEGISSLAYSADGKTLAIVSYPDDLTIVSGERAWRHPATLRTNRVADTLQFHPKDPRQLACCGHRLEIKPDGTCARAYVGGSTSFGPEGKVIAVQKDWEHLWFDLHDGDRTAQLREVRFCGPDRIAVSDGYVAYTMLDLVLIWDRQSQKIVRTFRNVPDTEWTWMPGYVQSLAFRGQNLLVASSNGEVAEWDVTKSKKLKVIVPVRSVEKK